MRTSLSDEEQDDESLYDDFLLGEDGSVINYDDGNIFVSKDDYVLELKDDDIIDEEDLPDVDYEEAASDMESCDEADDCINMFDGHEDEVYAVACSPTEPTLVATGGRDEKVFVWEIHSGRRSFELCGHNETVSAVAFRSDGQLLASGCLDGLVQIWDIPSGHCRCRFEGLGKGIEWVKWHPGGLFVLAGSQGPSVWICNTENGAYSNVFSLGTDREVVPFGDFTPHGKVIIAASDGGILKIWKAGSGENIHRVRGSRCHTGGLTCLVISPDSSLAFIGSKDGCVYVVNVTTGQVINILQGHSQSIQSIAFAPSSEWAATGGMDNMLIIWDMRQLSLRYIHHHKTGVTSLKWLGANRYVAAGCMDGNILVWDCLGGVCVKTLRGHRESIESFATSACGDFLVSGSKDKTARVFRISEFK